MSEGDSLGTELGLVEGDEPGLTDGFAEGEPLGAELGLTDGLVEGESLGEELGLKMDPQKETRLEQNLDSETDSWRATNLDSQRDSLRENRAQSRAWRETFETILFKGINVHVNDPFIYSEGRKGILTVLQRILDYSYSDSERAEGNRQ